MEGNQHNVGKKQDYIFIYGFAHFSTVILRWLTVSHSWIIFSIAFSSEYSLLAPSLMLSNFSRKDSRFISTYLRRFASSVGLRSWPAMELIFSQCLSRRPGLNRADTSGRCNLKSSTRVLTYFGTHQNEEHKEIWNDACMIMVKWLAV